MKVNYQFGMPGCSGKTDGLVYCYSRLQGRIYARRNTYPTLTSENERVGSITSALFKIEPSQQFRRDVYIYLIGYNNLRENHKRQIRSWSALYLKLMYDMAKADPSIDLRTLTREEIYLRDLPCISVKKAVEAGLLPKVLEWESYDKQI